MNKKPSTAPVGKTMEGAQIRKHLQGVEILILANDRNVAKRHINHILRNLEALEEKYAALAKTDFDKRHNPEQQK